MIALQTQSGRSEWKHREKHPMRNRYPKGSRFKKKIVMIAAAFERAPRRRFQRLKI
jgi:hypothetical protein